MTFFPVSGQDGIQDIQQKVSSNRLEQAKAFQEFVENNARMGVQTDPTALYNSKMMMTGGDPGMASLIPGGEALNHLADTMNKKADAVRQIATMTSAQAISQRKSFVQDIVNDMAFDSQDNLKKNLSLVMGQDAVDSFGPLLDEMQDEARLNTWDKFTKDPALEYINSEDELYKLRPYWQDRPEGKMLLRRYLSERNRKRDEAAVDRNTKLVNELPNNLSPEQLNAQIKAVAAPGQEDRIRAQYSVKQQAMQEAAMALIVGNMTENKEKAKAFSDALADVDPNRARSIAFGNLLESGLFPGITIDSPAVTSLMEKMKAQDVNVDAIRRAETITKTSVAVKESMDAASKSFQDDGAKSLARDIVAPLIVGKDAIANSQKYVDSMESAIKTIFGDGEGQIYHTKEALNAFKSFVQASDVGKYGFNANAVAQQFTEAYADQAKTRAEVQKEQIYSAVESIEGPAPQSASTFVKAETSNIDQVAEVVTNEAFTAIDADTETTPKQKNAAKINAVNHAIRALNDLSGRYASGFNDPSWVSNLSGLTGEEGKLLQDKIKVLVEQHKALLVDLSKTEASLASTPPQAGVLGAISGEQPIEAYRKKMAPQAQGREELEAEISDAIKALDSIERPTVWTVGPSVATQQSDYYVRAKKAAKDYLVSKYSKFFGNELEAKRFIENRGL